MNHLIIILMILSIFIIIIILNKSNIEGMINIPYSHEPSYFRRDDCKNDISKTISEIFNQYNIRKDNNWDVYLPCSYNWIQTEIKKIKPSHSNQKIFIISQADELTSKQKLWNNIVAKYGRNYAVRLSPRTYTLEDDQDMKLFDKEYDPDKIYIIKKNIQRQEGLLITKNKNMIKKSSDYFFVVAQELLQDPYLINNRKINMRIYLLIVCKDNQLDAWVHSNGFMYYTKVPFIKNSTDKDPNITTGYIDRQVYRENPLTHDDFRIYLDSNRSLSSIEVEVLNRGYRLSDYVFNNIYQLMIKVVEAVSPKIGKDKHTDNISFQLFGADVAIDDKLNAKIIEINKGPDLGAKDGRDKEVKHTVVKDMLKTLKLIPKDGENGFIPIVY